MTIYEKFSAYTNLPIRIDWVADQIREDCNIDEILFISAQMDVSILAGMHRMFKQTDASGNSRTILHVYYSSTLDDEKNHQARRLVCCKELLHAYDNGTTSATSIAAVDKLIEGIVVPPSIGMPASLISDHNGALHALMVLLPRDALDILIPQHQEGQLSVEDVALLAGIPEGYARLGLSSVWKEIVEQI